MEVIQQIIIKLEGEDIKTFMMLLDAASHGMSLDYNDYQSTKKDKEKMSDLSRRMRGLYD